MITSSEKKISLDINFYIKENKYSQTTGIREVIEVNGNKIISILFIKMLKKTHTQLFENLKIKFK